MQRRERNGNCVSFIRLLSALLVTAAVAGPATVCEAEYSLPAARAVNWQGHVGVLRDIPARKSVCASVSPSGGDDTAAIQRAINACPAGQVVQLKGGTFTISSPVTLKSAITLRGSGMGVTTIKGSSGAGGAYLLAVYNTAFHEGTPLGISAGLAKGSTSITTSAPHGWSAGDVIVIDQLNTSNSPPGKLLVSNSGVSGTSRWDGRTADRSLGQVNRVTAVTSHSATLEIPLYWDFDPALSPKATRLNQVIRDAGIEDLTVDNSLSGSKSQASNGGTIVFRGAADCWLERVEVVGSWESAVRVIGTFRNTFRSCKIHEGVPALPANGPQYGTSRAYGFFLNPYASANLFENNEVYHLVTPFMMHGAISGNVIAYNYLPAPYYKDSNWIQVTIEFHGAHPIMNLVEGNYSIGRISPDNYWGSSSHNTFFRNRNSLPPGKSGAPWNFDLQYHARYYNLVGNVVGTPGTEEVYQLHKVDLHGQKAIYRLGYRADGDGSADGNDAEVLATVLRHGNWDSVSRKVLWNGSDDRALPASLYLSGKPRWWGSGAWPPVGPDLSPMYPPDPGVGNGTPWGSRSSGASRKKR